MGNVRFRIFYFPLPVNEYLMQNGVSFSAYNLSINLNLVVEKSEKVPNTTHIKAFGMVAEKIGVSDLTMDYYQDSAALLDALLVKFPALKSIKFSLAINKKLISTKQEIPENAEIALLPPFSGG